MSVLLRKLIFPSSTSGFPVSMNVKSDNATPNQGNAGGEAPFSAVR